MTASVEAKVIRRWMFIMYATIVGAPFLCAFMVLVPYSVSDAYYCSDCRARRLDTKVQLLKTDSRIIEHGIADYWSSQIDLNHKHSWRHYWNYRLPIDRAVGDKITDIILGGHWHEAPISIDEAGLPTDAEIAILRSFKTPAERKAFAKDFLLWYPTGDGINDTDNKSVQIQMKLKDAYKQNPSRKDWQTILKRMGIVK